MSLIFESKHISLNFGGLKALDDISLKLYQGEIIALIGPNGAGKTTFFNCLSGIYKPNYGELNLYPPKSKSISLKGLKPHKVTEAGLSRTFQNIRLFNKMTALQNVMVGKHCRSKNTFVDAIFQTTRFKREEKETLESSYQLLKEVGLSDFSHQLACNLSYAHQRKLEIARALATEPLLLLLDEPAAGMNPQETKDLDELIVYLRDKYDLSILLIEHDMKLVMRLSEKIFVMNQGKNIATGSPHEIQNNSAVIEAYLGT